MFNLMILVAWFISAVIDYSEFCYLWQLKEYRWDRFKDFLVSRKGANYWVSYPMLWRSLITLILFFWPINDGLLSKYVLALFFIIDIAIQSVRYFKDLIRLPVRTKKALLLIFLALSFEGSVFLITRDWTFLLLLIIARFFIFAAWVKIIQYPTRLAKQYFINKATQKLASYKNLKVIGITGSFGKTTTKEFLAHFLAAKFRVVKTPEHVNTDIGIAKFILNTNFSNYDIFVVEMGAYKIGEIAAICKIVKPSIGILTGINEQHLSLFGSKENIVKAKYELLRALPSAGQAIINRDYAYYENEIKKIKCKIITYGLDPELKPDNLYHDIKSTAAGIYLRGVIGGREEEMIAPIFGEHVANNIGACGAAANLLGLTAPEFMSRLSTLKNPEKTMKRFKFGRAILIDDSHNSNPDGFMGALNALSVFPSHLRRVVITRGMLELGEETDEQHERVGGSIAYSIDELVLASAENAAAIKRGMGTKHHVKVKEINSETELIAYLKNVKNQQAVILIENRLIGGVYDWLRNQLKEV